MAERKLILELLIAESLEYLKDKDFDKGVNAITEYVVEKECTSLNRRDAYLSGACISFIHDISDSVKNACFEPCNIHYTYSKDGNFVVQIADHHLKNMITTAVRHNIRQFLAEIDSGLYRKDSYGNFVKIELTTPIKE